MIMSIDIARIVSGLLSSDRMFSIGDGVVWIPLSEDAFHLASHIEQALVLHGYKAHRTRARVYCGTTIEVNGAESISHEELQGVLQETYGYKGRVAGMKLNPHEQPWNENPIEPGNILEIPHIGWTGDRCRVVIGHYDGTYLAQLHTPRIDDYKKEPLEIIRGERRGEKVTLSGLLGDEKVIVKKREWSSYPQQAYS